MSRAHWFRNHSGHCTCAECTGVRLAGGDTRLRREPRAAGDYEVDGYGRYWKIEHPLLSPKAAAELEETLERAYGRNAKIKPPPLSPKATVELKETLDQAEAEQAEAEPAEKQGDKAKKKRRWWWF